MNRKTLLLNRTRPKNNEIWYTTIDDKILTASEESIFDNDYEEVNKLISNTYENGQGVLVYENELTSIYMGMFQSCVNLKTVVIPDSIEIIGHDSFNGCSNLEIINIPNNVKNIKWYAFKDCDNLKEVHINNLEAWCNIDFDDSGSFEDNNPIENAKKIYLCGEVVTDLIIPFNINKIGAWSFVDCESLKSVNMFDNITSINRAAFSSCYNLKNIIFSENLTKIEHLAFYNCSGLTQVIIPDSVTTIDDSAFNGCSELTNVTLGKSLKSIGRDAFSKCQFSSITIPNGVTTIGIDAFFNCTELTSITIPDSVIKIDEHICCGCDSLESIIVSKENKVYDSRENCNAIIETATNTLISSCKNTKIPYGVVNIGNGAFIKNRFISEIIIPDSVVNIGSDVFFDCDNITNFIIPDSVISIGDGAFRYCKNLKSITIGKNISTFGEDVFYECGSLESIIVSKENKVYDSRENCNAIIETATNTLITSIENAIIPYGVEVIGKKAFYWNINLKEYTIPDSVKIIKEQAFEGCDFTQITIPDSVTDIEKQAFTNVPLTSVTIGSGVISIRKNNFDTTSIKEVYCKKIEPLNITENDKIFVASAISNSKLFVPMQSVEAYKNHVFWGKFGQIEGYEF